MITKSEASAAELSSKFPLYYASPTSAAPVFYSSSLSLHIVFHCYISLKILSDIYLIVKEF